MWLSCLTPGTTSIPGVPGMSETPVAKVHWLLVLVDGWRMEHLAAEEEEEVDGWHTWLPEAWLLTQPGSQERRKRRREGGSEVRRSC